MNVPSPRDDGTPYWLEKPPSGGRKYWWLLLAILLVGIAGAYWFWQEIQQRPPGAPQVTAPQPAPQPAPQAQAPAAVSEATPAIQHPIVTPPPPEAQAPANTPEPLPPLSDSDRQMTQAIAGLIGAEAVAQYLYPDQIITRIVATVDNLPRQQAPERVMPVKPVPGAFTVDRTGDAMAIGAANAARYAPYVALFDALPTKKLVDVYSYFYPLFQKAYVNLGYPNRYFNDRLFETIDDLLAAPAPQEPIALAQPKVQYEFADPDLEARSAGQKIMMRMGAQNEAKVKAKLQRIRRALVNR